MTFEYIIFIKIEVIDTKLIGNKLNNSNALHGSCFSQKCIQNE